jgi:L-lactate dehydrogenase complex protein LldF
MGVSRDPWLPFASSLCGACAEVCPVKIDIPRLLLELRTDVNEAKEREGTGRLERLAFRAWAFVMRRPRLYELLGMMGSAALGGDGRGGWLKSLPGLLRFGPAAAWLGERDLPTPAPKSFRQLWRERVH